MSIGGRWPWPRKISGPTGLPTPGESDGFSGRRALPGHCQITIRAAKVIYPLFEESLHHPVPGGARNGDSENRAPPGSQLLEKRQLHRGGKSGGYWVLKHR